MKTISSILTLVLLVIPYALFCQWSNNPVVNNNINNLPGEQAIPKIATCSNGDSYIAFFSNEGGNYNVRLQRLNALGYELWETGGILISNHTQMSWLTDWDMCIDNENGVILTFQDIRNAGNNNVVAYRISPSGEFIWGDNGIALSNSSAFDVSPKVVVTQAGNAVFAWQSDEVIILQKIAPAGELLWGNTGIVLSCDDTYSWPQLLPVGNDEVILKYFHDTGPAYAPTRHVYAQKFDADGNAIWASPVGISKAGGISAWTQIFPFINDGNDGFYIAWHDDRDNDMIANIFVQRVSSEGVYLWDENGVEVSVLSGRNHFYPQLALPPGTSDLYVFWNEMDADQNLRGIYAQKISEDGTRIWSDNGETLIEMSTVNVYPVALRNSSEDVILVYEEFSNAVDANLKAMRIDHDGELVWAQGMMPICMVNSQKVHTVVNHFSNNQLIISWEDDRDGNKDIFAQNIQLNGELGPYWVSVDDNGYNGNIDIKLHVSPNPFRDHLEVSFELSTKSSVSLNIHSSHGILLGNLFEGELLEGEHSIDLSAAIVELQPKPGVYFLTLRVNDAEYTEVLLKN